MSGEAQAYGLWSLVLVNSVLFVGFAFSFFRPRTRRDWRSFGAFSAFLVALFTEMYGFPLTVYLLSGWLAARFPGVDFLAHGSGHLLEAIFGWRSNPHFGLFHAMSAILVAGGFIVLLRAWPVLFDAQLRGQLATRGPYALVRHPQYDGLILIMVGFLLQWPTLATLAMFPVLVFMYVRLARTEEQESIEKFGEEYRRYMMDVPRFLPRLSGAAGRKADAGDA